MFWEGKKKETFVQLWFRPFRFPWTPLIIRPCFPLCPFCWWVPFTSLFYSIQGNDDFGLSKGYFPHFLVRNCLVIHINLRFMFWGLGFWVLTLCVLTSLFSSSKALKCWQGKFQLVFLHNQQFATTFRPTKMKRMVTTKNSSLGQKIAMYFFIALSFTSILRSLSNRYTWLMGQYLSHPHLSLIANWVWQEFYLFTILY